MSILVRSLQWEQRNYQRLVRLRDTIFKPLLPELTALGINPLILSIGGVCFMIVFAALFYTQPAWAAFCFIVSLLCDWVDGPLARYQGTASDKGKFIDVVADTTSFAFFLVGISWANHIDPRFAVYLLIGVIVAKILGIIRNAPYLISDWYFKPTAGVLPLVVVGLFYGVYGIFVISSLALFDTAAYISFGILGIDMLYSLKNIVGNYRLNKANK